MYAHPLLDPVRYRADFAKGLPISYSSFVLQLVVAVVVVVVFKLSVQADPRGGCVHARLELWLFDL